MSQSFPHSVKFWGQGIICPSFTSPTRSGKEQCTYTKRGKNIFSIWSLICSEAKLFSTLIADFSWNTGFSSTAKESPLKLILPIQSGELIWVSILSSWFNKESYCWTNKNLSSRPTSKAQCNPCFLPKWYRLLSLCHCWPNWLWAQSFVAQSPSF